MLRHRHGSSRADGQPGFILTYHGCDIGVVERVDAPDAYSSPTLYVRGGLSGSLRFTIPPAAIAAVFPEQRRVALADQVTFEPEAVGQDGEVLLIARTPPAASSGDWQPSRAVPRTSSGFRVYADDGFLGEIEATLGSRADTVDYLVVRVRHWFRTFRPVLPARYVIECEPLDGTVVVVGTRRELRRVPELPPLAT